MEARKILEHTSDQIIFLLEAHSCLLCYGPAHLTWAFFLSLEHYFMPQGLCLSVPSAWTAVPYTLGLMSSYSSFRCHPTVTSPKSLLLTSTQILSLNDLSSQQTWLLVAAESSMTFHLYDSLITACPYCMVSEDLHCVSKAALKRETTSPNGVTFAQPCHQSKTTASLLAVSASPRSGILIQSV